MTTEVNIANTNNKHAVLVKMMRGYAVAHEQIIAPGKEGAVLVYAGQTVTIEEIEAEHVEPVESDVTPPAPVEVSDQQPAPDAPAPAADAGVPEQAPTEAAPVDAPVAPAKPAAKKKAATAK